MDRSATRAGRRVRRRRDRRSPTPARCWVAALAALLLAPPAEADFSLLLAGDAILVEPWADDEDPAFRALVAAMRSADAAILNLETILHDYEGHPQADSGGAWLRSPPSLAADLAWAGVDMVSHANNHSFDYGSVGVLTNREHVERAGIALAGSGADLQRARAPATFDSAGGRVALVSAAATFVPYGRASASRPDVAGRPGLNPLQVTSAPRVFLPAPWAAAAGRLARSLGFGGWRFGRRQFEIAGVEFRTTGGFGLRVGARPEDADREGNLAAVRRAAAEADWVVFSLHDHALDSWMPRFAREVIDAGADVVLVHGRHSVQGLALYRGKPIIHGLGDFGFQQSLIERIPQDAFDALGLGLEADRDDLLTERTGGLDEPYWPREAWEGVVASLGFDTAGTLTTLELLPLDLRRDAPPPATGRPRLASPEIGRKVIADFARASSRLGARVRYDAARNVGVVAVD